MHLREPSQLNALYAYRPPCPTCGALMILARIEPALEPDHDLRTFECEHCGTSEVVKVKFR